MACGLMETLVGGLSGERKTSVHCQQIALRFEMAWIPTSTARYPYNVQHQRFMNSVCWISRILWRVCEQVGQGRQRLCLNWATHWTVQISEAVSIKDDGRSDATSRARRGSTGGSKYRVIMSTVSIDYCVPATPEERICLKLTSCLHVALYCCG